MKNFFIGLGFMKCGTTFITQQLLHHPDIYLPPIRELHYWTNHFAGNPGLPRQQRYAVYAADRIRKKAQQGESIRDEIALLEYWQSYADTTPDGLQSYEALFAPRRNERAAGEITPAYSELTLEQLKQIAAMIPGTRALIMMRAPYARLVSHYNHTYRHRPETLATDRAALEWLDSQAVRDRVEYGRVIRDARVAFGEDRVSSLFFEDMAQDPAGFLRGVLDFIGVEFHPAVLTKIDRRKSKGAEKRPMSETLQSAFHARVAHVAGEVEELLGRVPDNWKS